ncbi:hypothetical protein BCR36DRAFT_299703 [Piromyces finnis]|uniref:Uncharacterized protein n=1 Tax=Piromyces finnis TaxID=1754191 RepID=A0A1Y1V231_9FUNG|nr:hypothetical protein BCR36DRAFT_299703 [Piromyces finnis]|eukprot:ORX45453.1 hypothetical protein BCR36DRAFT_299703 [Piromyces finnis]
MGGLFESIDFEEMHKFMNNTQDIEFIESYNRKKDIMKKVYLVIFIIYMVIGIFSLGMFYHLRNWYIIKQRNFNLTFTNGISAFFSGAMTLLVQFYENVPCPVNLYTSDVVNPFYNAIFLSRSLRIVLLYHFNIFKVTALKKKSGRFKLKESYIGEKEPNYYLPKIYNKVDKIIYGVILIPTLTAFIITLIIHILNFDKCKFEVFGMSPTEQLKTDNSAHSLFTVAQYSGLIFAGAFLIVLFFLAKVKDSSKYGAKVKEFKI